MDSRLQSIDSRDIVAAKGLLFLLHLHKTGEYCNRWSCCAENSQEDKFEKILSRSSQKLCIMKNELFTNPKVKPMSTFATARIEQLLYNGKSHIGQN